jgi:hypothetical protein
VDTEVIRREPERRIYGFVNDLGGPDLHFFPRWVISGDRAYCILEALTIINDIGAERAAEMGIGDYDNPVLVMVKLKQ